MVERYDDAEQIDAARGEAEDLEYAEAVKAIRDKGAGRGAAAISRAP
jgi:hypothetical protein